MSTFFRSLFSYKSIEDKFRFLIDSISCNNEISFNDCLMSTCCICGTWGGRNPLFKFAHQLFSSSSGVKGTIGLSISAQPAFKIFSLNKAVFTISITFLSSKVCVLFHILIDTERKPYSDKQEHILFGNMSRLEAPASLPSLPAELDFE